MSAYIPYGYNKNVNYSVDPNLTPESSAIYNAINTGKPIPTSTDNQIKTTLYPTTTTTPTPLPTITPTTTPVKKQPIGIAFAPTTQPTTTPQPTQSTTTPSNANNQQVPSYMSMVGKSPTPIGYNENIAPTYDKLIQSKIDAIRAAIQQSIANQQNIITKAPETFRPQREQMYTNQWNEQKYNQENMNRLGLTDSGQNLTNQNQINSSIGQQLNQLSVAQQNIITDANTKIQDLTNQGKIDEANAVYDNATNELNAIEKDKQYVDTTNYNQGQDYIKNAINATQYDTQNNQWNKTFESNQTQQDFNNQQIKQKNFTDTMTGLGNRIDYTAEIQKLDAGNDPDKAWKIPILQQAAAQKQQTNLQNDIATIGQYSNDYNAEINKRVAANPNDPLIPFLRVAVAEKLDKLKTSQLTGEQAIQKQVYDNWKTSGVADINTQKYLGIPSGTTTVEYAKTIQDAINNADKNKIEAAKVGATINETKKSAYFDSVSKSVNNLLKTLYETEDPVNAKIESPPGSGKYINNPNPGTMLDYAKRIGTAEHKRVVDLIENSGLSQQEKLILYNSNDIPIPQ